MTPQSGVERGRTTAGEHHWISQLATGLPFVGRPNVDSYLETLEHALADHHLTDEEISELTTTARSLGIGQKEADLLHRDFLVSLTLLAWADGTITEEETEDLNAAATALGVDTAAVTRLISGSDNAHEDFGVSALKPGDCITFTGETELPRWMWEERAREAGLDIGGVRKSSVLLVAADPSTVTGKLRRARELDIPIVSEATFARLLGQMEGSDASLDAAQNVEHVAHSHDEDNAVDADLDVFAFLDPYEDSSAQSNSEAEAVTSDAFSHEVAGLFPWLNDSSDQHFLAAGPVSELNPESIASEWISKHHDQPLQQLSPFLEPATEPSFTGNDKQRQRRWRDAYPELLTASVDELIELPGVGATTLHSWVTDVAAEALRLANKQQPGENLPEEASDQDLSRKPPAGSDDQVAALDIALEALGVLEKLHGSIEAAFSVAGTHEPFDDERVRMITTKLTDPRGTYSEVRDQRRGNAAAELANFAAQLGVRETLILTRRLAADEPDTLDQLGEMLGLTRERVRQIERPLRDALFELAIHPGPVADLLIGIRAHAYPVGTVENITAVFPELSDEVEGWETTLLHALDVLDKEFLIESGWVCFPSLKVAAAATQEILEKAANEEGVVPLSEITARTTLDEGTLIAWLETCGYRILDDHVLTRVNSIPARAMGFLSVLGRPASTQELLALSGLGRTERSFNNAMSTHDSVIRTRPDTWGLKRWGLEEYTTLSELIARRVDAARAEGREGVALDELKEELATKFGVSESSVVTYSTGPDFEVQDGIVGPRENQLVNDATPEESRGMFLVDGHWMYLLSITSDHLRGSGSAVPAGMTAMLHVPAGGSVEVPSEYGPQSFSWNTTHNTGTIRRFLDAQGFSEGDRIYLDVHDGERFEVHPAPQREGRAGLGGIADDMGLEPTGTNEDIQDRIAAAIGLSAGAPRRKILARLRHRRENDMVGVLEELWL